MTETEAFNWLRENIGISAEQAARLRQFTALLLAENEHQNLISKASAADIWRRHIVDSAQLLAHAPDDGDWLDIGTGPGLPGMVIALCSARRVTLCEPRTRRVAFLRSAVAALGLGDRVTIAPLTAARLKSPPFAVISARAVAALDVLLEDARHLSTANSVWILPKGRHGDEELAHSYQCDMFHVKRSITDPDSVILVGKGKPRP